MVRLELQSIGFWKTTGSRTCFCMLLQWKAYSKSPQIRNMSRTWFECSQPCYALMTHVCLAVADHPCYRLQIFLRNYANLGSIMGLTTRQLHIFKSCHHVTMKLGLFHIYFTRCHILHQKHVKKMSKPSPSPGSTASSQA